MAAAMVIPVIPFLCLVWFGVTESALCGGYCALSVAAMLALMYYRRSERTRCSRALRGPDRGLRMARGSWMRREDRVRFSYFYLMKDEPDRVRAVAPDACHLLAGPRVA